MERVAIVGLSCIVPGANNAREFWRALTEQDCSISLLSADDIGVDPSIFFDPSKGKDDRFYFWDGGFTRDIQFDMSGYYLPAKFLDSLDPLCKVAILVGKQALQDSHYLGNKPSLSRCGAILGNLSFPTHTSNRLFSPIYQQALSQMVGELLQTDDFHLVDRGLSIHRGASAQQRYKPTNHFSPCNALTSSLPSAIVAKALGLGGTHLSLDAACASSLYAIKMACYQLASGKADLMLAGGISYADPLFVRMMFSGLQTYPENHISAPLDRASRGVATSEGAGMLVLKRYRDAVGDGDRIYATILGNGLSNDGRGKHLLSPNIEGQIRAFERAYAEAGIEPREIDYLECHSTGTPLGDTTELAAIDRFFGQHRATPLVGTVKSNVGHLLTAAGLIGTIKVLLGMSEELIPATVRVEQARESPRGVVSAAHIPRTAVPWPDRGLPKRAAVNAFGFGGTSAHLVLERSEPLEEGSTLPASTTTENAIEDAPALPPIEMAIVGMDACFGACSNLELFERSIYEGQQHFIPVPKHRWKGLDSQASLLKDMGVAGGEAPDGAFIEELSIDPLQYKIPPNELERLHPQQVLMLKVADRALKDSGLPEGGNVAVIIAIETDPSVHQLQQRWHVSHQLEEELERSQPSLARDRAEHLISAVQDSLHPPAQATEYVGYIGNIVASRISSLWDFSGPSFTLSSGENSTSKALEMAQLLLSSGDADAVLVGAVDLAGGLETVAWRSQISPLSQGVKTLSFDRKADGWIVGEGAGAVVLKKLDDARREGRSKIYAVVNAIGLDRDCVDKSCVDESNGDFPVAIAPTAIQEVCQQALQEAGVRSRDIGYLEVSGSGIREHDESEVKGLLQAYGDCSAPLNCAVGSIKANIGHTQVASGIASLIKTALCLYHRYIPAVPQWSGPKQAEQWRDGPFYIACASQPWLLEEGTSKRIAAINSLGIDGSCAHIVLTESPVRSDSERYQLSQTPPYLFPIAANSRNDLLEQLNSLKQVAGTSQCIAAAANRCFSDFQKRETDAVYALAILGRDRAEIEREIDRAFDGVNRSFDRQTDWSTPSGSYFTSNPLGRKSKVAFVYPGAFGAYIGLARDLFRLFPSIYNERMLTNVNSRVGPVTKRLYPRSVNRPSRRRAEELENQLFGDPIAMFEAELFYARITTAVLEDCFRLKPDCVFGYSLGEASMMCAQRVWKSFGHASQALGSSPLFKNRIAGPKYAVQEYWGLKSHTAGDAQNLWGNFVLMASPSQVQDAMKDRERVYLTQINSPQEVVIAGDPQACQQLISHLQCNAFRAPFNHAIHCEAIRSEYGELVNLNNLPLQEAPDITFYSAAKYEPIEMSSVSISQNIANNLCHQLDFPRLVNQIYNDNVRVFIEAGASSICTRWIGEILKQEDHLVVPFNQKGIEDRTSYCKAFAKLLSHRVSVNLSRLYSLEDSSNFNTGTGMARVIKLGGNPINSTILTPENKTLFESDFSRSASGAKHVPRDRAVSSSEKTALNDRKLPAEPALASNRGSFDSPQFGSVQPECDWQATTGATGQGFDDKSKGSKTNSFQANREISMIEDYRASFKKLVVSNEDLTRVHSSFLRKNQDFISQMSKMLEVKANYARQYFENNEHP